MFLFLALLWFGHMDSTFFNIVVDKPIFKIICEKENRDWRVGLHFSFVLNESCSYINEADVRKRCEIVDNALLISFLKIMKEITKIFTFFEEKKLNEYLKNVCTKITPMHGDCKIILC